MRDKLLAALEAGADRVTLRQLLLEFAQAGGTSDDAVTMLTELRALVANPASDALDDRVLELLDVATGWCSVDQRIWPPRQAPS
jgi:hypothetical protein